MKKEFKCIMLIDDNPDDNFFHEREIKKAFHDNIVISKNSGKAALEYLKSGKDPLSDLILLDINMPGMNGWEFLEEYGRLSKELQGQAIIIMLTTSDNSTDMEKAKKYSMITDYITKPLTVDIIKNITDKYFN